ncbi:Uncharacterised protein [uncultured archaeon]|nr:Uncharacterised protein [uncultured archaeon]
MSLKTPITILFATIMVLFFITGCSAIDNSPVEESQAKADPDKVVDGASQVFMTTDVSSNGLKAVYEALSRPAKGNVAIKIHIGEPGNTNFLSPELIHDLTLSVNGTFVDSNTAYGGSRASTAAHLQVARDHGFTYAPVDILDADGEIRLPITGGNKLNEAIIGSHYRNYDFIISIAHFKGHLLAGFGGTFKNLAVGMASVNGKKAIHNEPGGAMFSSSGDAFLEKVAEYTKAVIDDKRDNIVYINVLSNLSVDCDCVGNAAKPEIEDIGILASLDPVALDRASVDLIYAAPEEERQHLVERIESRNGTHLLDYAEELGLGSQNYELVKLDD